MKEDESKKINEASNQGDSATVGGNTTKLAPESTERKDESGTNVLSEISDDDMKNMTQKKAKRVYNEAELEQNVYITISETDTNILYFAPSTRVIANKQRKYTIYPHYFH